MPGWTVNHGAPGTQVPTARLAGIVRPIRSQVQQFVDGTSGATRVWLFTLLLAALTLVLAVQFVPADLPMAVPIVLPVWLLAAGFYLAEAKVIHLHIGRSAHSFSMSELPMVAGLFLVSPPAFIAARLVGSALALFFNRRQRSVKLAFNLAQFSLASVVSVAIVHAVVSPGGRLRTGGLGRGPARRPGREPHRRPERQHRDLAGRGDRRSTGGSRRCSRSGSSSRSRTRASP